MAILIYNNASVYWCPLGFFAQGMLGVKIAFPEVIVFKVITCHEPPLPHPQFFGRFNLWKIHQNEGKWVGLEKEKKKTLWGQEHTLCGDIKNRRQRTNKQTWNVWIKGKTTKVGNVQNFKKKSKKKSGLWPFVLGNRVLKITGEAKVCKMSQSKWVKVPCCPPLPLSQTSFNNNRIVYHRPTA